mmetsp:Transcript_30694/g.68842  ORF Transcript_30694/g.68842 Transcript_30694/m.68842 type:complete len:209 (+) Transcript_30694:859-1485(+)
MSQRKKRSTKRLSHHRSVNRCTPRSETSYGVTSAVNPRKNMFKWSQIFSNLPLGSTTHPGSLRRDRHDSISRSSCSLSSALMSLIDLLMLLANVAGGGGVGRTSLPLWRSRDALPGEPEVCSIVEGLFSSSATDRRSRFISLGDDREESISPPILMAYCCCCGSSLVKIGLALGFVFALDREVFFRMIAMLDARDMFKRIACPKQRNR